MANSTLQQNAPTPPPPSTLGPNTDRLCDRLAATLDMVKNVRNRLFGTPPESAAPAGCTVAAVNACPPVESSVHAAHSITSDIINVLDEIERQL